MKSLRLAVCAILALSASLASAGDPRNLREGREIPDQNYADQPYVVVGEDGRWFVVLTTGPGHEGHHGQHIIGAISEDQGRTWSKPVAIEPQAGPEASWGVPFLSKAGRIYVFYTYNDTGISNRRADTIGAYAFKYSDDFGKTWSKRHKLPMRTTAVDRKNPSKGKFIHFWGVDKPKVHGGTVLFAFTKLQDYSFAGGEGWVFRSDNLLTETDVSKLHWEMLPPGEHGIHHPDFGKIQEENTMVPLDDGSWYMIYRTEKGFAGETYSRDGGKTWSEPQKAVYRPGGRAIKQPRANIKPWKTSGGKYLLWYHNNSHPGWVGRNPAWLCGGVERDGRIYWSEPEIVLYDEDPGVRFSYPDLIEHRGRFWLSETNKLIARTHPLDPGLLEGLWNQHRLREVAQKGLAVEWKDGPALAMPKLPDLSKDGGFSLEIDLTPGKIDAGQIVLDATDESGRGVLLRTAKDGVLELVLNDGKKKRIALSDPGTLAAGKRCHVVVTVDGAPNIVTFVVDGVLQDGGPHRHQGWTRFDVALGDVNGKGSLRIAPDFDAKVHLARVYDRAIRTSEAVGNYRAAR